MPRVGPIRPSAAAAMVGTPRGRTATATARIFRIGGGDTTPPTLASTTTQDLHGSATFRLLARRQPVRGGPSYPPCNSWITPTAPRHSRLPGVRAVWIAIEREFGMLLDTRWWQRA